MSCTRRYESTNIGANEFADSLVVSPGTNDYEYYLGVVNVIREKDTALTNFLLENEFSLGSPYEYRFGDGDGELIGTQILEDNMYEVGDKLHDEMRYLTTKKEHEIRNIADNVKNFLPYYKDVKGTFCRIDLSTMTIFNIYAVVPDREKLEKYILDGRG